MSPHSVSRRLLISVTLLLLVFFGMMMFVLDARFRSIAESSLRELLDAQIVALIASAQTDDAGAVIPSLQDTEARLRAPGSGLYAAIHGIGGRVFWRSPSTIGSLTRFGVALTPGDREFRYLDSERGARLAAVSRGLRWEDDTGSARDLTFTRGHPSSRATRRQLQGYRRSLLGSFLVLAALLLLALALLLRWALVAVAPAGGADPIEWSAATGNGWMIAGPRNWQAWSPISTPCCGRAHAHRALSRHAGQSRAQPQDAAGSAACDGLGWRPAGPRR